MIAALFFLLAGVVKAEQPHWPTQSGNPIQCNFGFKKVATPTITIDDVTPVNLVDYLPDGTIGFELRAASGSFVIGHHENIATGSSRVGRLVVEDEPPYIWSGNAGTFVGAVLGTATSTVIVLDGAWGFSE
jgi:hypothetical protein